MKKIIFIFLALFVISCQTESLQSLEENSEKEVSTMVAGEIKGGRFFFVDWKEFDNTYLGFQQLSLEELEMKSFFSFDRNLDVSPEIQGILNDDNEFMLADKIIWLNEGIFYELEDTLEIEEQKVDLANLKRVGTVTNTPVNIEGNYTKSVPIANQHEFWKQRYVEDCGTGKVQGASPRKFKFVHEAYAEKFQIGLSYYYILYLRVKLEYQSGRSGWRASGEKRTISINLDNTSFLRNQFGIIGGSGQTNNPIISFSNLCASDQRIFLNSFNAGGVIPGAYWDINVRGVITDHMIGDVISNRWVDQVNW